MIRPNPRRSDARPKRVLTRLGAKLDKNLIAYAAAATAAGVAAIAGARPAEAKIIYKAANIPVNETTGVVNLDLNRDGINDFAFSAFYYRSGRERRPPEGYHYSSGLQVSPAQQSNRLVAVKSQGIFCAAELPKGRRVGPGARFQPGLSALFMADAGGGLTSTSGFHVCPWGQANEAYLGLKFAFNGKVHFGWVRFKMLPEQAGFGGAITGYAYETVPNKPILTGKQKGPASLGALAAGVR